MRALCHVHASYPKELVLSVHALYPHRIGVPYHCMHVAKDITVFTIALGPMVQYLKSVCVCVCVCVCVVADFFNYIQVYMLEMHELLRCASCARARYRSARIQIYLLDSRSFVQHSKYEMYAPSDLFIIPCSGSLYQTKHLNTHT